MNLFMHSADVSNPCKPWRVCKAWALRVLEEFFVQGDREKELGIPVQMLNDRNKVQKPSSQVGFVEFIVSPLIAGQVKLFPAVCELGVNLDHNLQNWERIWLSEARPPSDEEVAKLR